MLPDWVSNSGPLTYESGALPIGLRGPAKQIPFQGKQFCYFYFCCNCQLGSILKERRFAPRGENSFLKYLRQTVWGYIVFVMLSVYPFVCASRCSSTFIHQSFVLNLYFH